MKSKEVIKWRILIAGIVSTACGFINFDNNSVLQIILKLSEICLLVLAGIAFMIGKIYLYCESDELKPAELEGIKCSLKLVKEKKFIEYKKNRFFTESSHD